MIKYLHIGYPKNFSTSLQRNFFSLHPDVYHLGIGHGSNIAYRDNLVSSIFEVYLKSAKEFKYREVQTELVAHINYHLKEAEKLNKKAFGVSSEHISFSFTYDSLDFKTKFERAVGLLGKDVHVIMIIREQLEMIQSLYRESVRVGLPLTYKEYLYSLYKFQDRNYYYDLRYDLVYEQMTKLIDKSNIHIFTFEKFRDKSRNLKLEGDKVLLVDELCKALEVDFFNAKFEHYNEALSDNVIKVKVDLNKKYRHDLGNDLYSAAELHRQASYFTDELGLVESENELFKDVITKRRLMQEAMEIVEKTKFEISKKELFQCNENILNRVVEFYKNGNKKFTELSGIQLPEYYS